MLPLILTLALAPPAITARELSVPGAVVDVLERPGDQALLSVTRGGARVLAPLAGQKRVAVPGDAVFADSCGGRVVFATPRGIVDEDGVALAGDALFRVPDPERLFEAALCSRTGELWLPTPTGLKTPSGTLSFPRPPRAYTGESHGALRGRDYGAALSLYAPGALEADLDGDGDLDLVLTYRGRAAAFRRGPKGLEAEPRPVPLPRAPGSDLRFLLADLDGDGRAELVVTALKGLVPERTRAWRVSELLGEAKTSALWERVGFTAPLGFDAGARELLVFHVDTSVVAMGAVLVTGRLPLTVERWTPRGFERLAELEIAASVTAGITGNLPALVDLDDDGDLDLVDTGTEEARVFLRSQAGFSKKADHAWPAARVEHVHALEGAAVLVARGKGGRSRLLVISR